MAGRITGYFVVLLLLFDPSSAFLVDKCNMDLDFQKLLEQGQINANDVLQAADVLSNFFQENPILAQRYSSINIFVKELVRQGASLLIMGNMAYFKVTIYLGPVVLTSYCFLIHSRKQLGEAESIERELNVIIEGEVQPILQYIETLLNKCTENGSVKACQGVNFEEMEMQLKQRKDKIQNVIKEIKSLRDQSIEGEEQSKVLQVLVVGGAVTGAVAAPKVVPSVLGASIVVLSLGFVGSWGYIHFETSKENYQKSLQLLEEMNNRAFEAKKAIIKLQTDLGIIAMHHGFGTPQLNGNY